VYSSAPAADVGRLDRARVSANHGWMSRCSRCSAIYPEHVLICPNDGEVLDTGNDDTARSGDDGDSDEPQLVVESSRSRGGEWENDLTVPFHAQRHLGGFAPTGQLQLSVTEAQLADLEPEPPKRGSEPNDQVRDLLPAGLVVGDYEVTRHLDSGGMADVYEGVHPLIGKAVAIKVLSRTLSSDPAMVDRFIQEARAVNQIRHHNIVDIFALGRLRDGRVYCVMEFLDGESLQKRLRRAPGMTYEEALTVLSQMCDGLEAAHKVRIVHRDLKPENVFLIETARGPLVKLLDFGIAKLIGAEKSGRPQTRAGMLIGTPEYMAPEQCMGQDIDTRTDVYALGVIMFEMFTGRLPFDAKSSLHMISAHVDSEPLDPRTLGVPEELGGLILDCLAKPPADRPQTVGKVRERLAAVLQELGFELAAATPLPQAARRTGGTPVSRGTPSVPRTRPGTKEVVRKGSRRIAGLVGTGVVLVLAAIGATVVIAKFRNQDEQKPAAAAAPPTAYAIGVPIPVPTPEPAVGTAEVAMAAEQPLVAPPVLNESGGDPRKPRVARPLTGAAPVIKELHFRPNVAWMGEKATVSGTVGFDDADGDLKALGLETRAPAGRSRGQPTLPLRLAGAKSGTAAFSFIFDPTETGTHVFDIWALDKGGNASRRLSGSIEVMERDKPQPEKAKEPAREPAAADAGPPEAPARPPGKSAAPPAKP
jgi:eukaryotic-like serine/threonine-protein kinase